MLSTNLWPQTSRNQKLMMLTPDGLTTNQSEECPRLSTHPTTPSLILVLKTFPWKPPGCCAFWALAAWTCCLAPAINAAAFSFSTTWCPLTGFNLHGWRTQVWSRNTFTFILLFEPPWPNKCRKREVTCSSLSPVWLFVILQTAACQAPLSMEFSRQEYRSGLPFPSPGGLPDQGLNPGLLHWRGDSLPSEQGLPGKRSRSSNKPEPLAVAPKGNRAVRAPTPVLWLLILCVCHCTKLQRSPEAGNGEERMEMLEGYFHDQDPHSLRFHPECDTESILSLPPGKFRINCLKLQRGARILAHTLELGTFLSPFQFLRRRETPSSQDSGDRNRLWGHVNSRICYTVLSHVWLFATLWTVACQAPLSTEFLKQEYWSG